MNSSVDGACEICLVFGGSLFGTGQASRWQSLIRAATDFGHKVDLIQLVSRREQTDVPRGISAHIESVQRISLENGSRFQRAYLPPGAAGAAAVADRAPQQKVYDVLICEPVQAWAFGRAVPARFRVVGFTNDDAARQLTYARRARTHQERLRHWWLATQCMRFELAAIRESSCAWFVSPVERERLQRFAWGTRCITVPNGASREFYSVSRSPAECSATALFVGSSTYQPNVDGLQWYLKHVWPRVLSQVNARMLVAGFGWMPSSSPGTNVEVVGYVERLEDVVAEARVVVAPLLSGGGTKVKILEGMAAGRPIVTTPVGAEGLPVSDGVRVAAAADSFALETVKLLKSGELARRLGESNRMAVRSNAWEDVWMRAFREIGLSASRSVSDVN